MEPSADRVKNDYRVYAEAERREMLRFVPTGASRILDVGCSVGNFGILLKAELDAEVWGVEIDAEAAKLAEKVIDHVICGPFDKAADLPPGYFDCIVFNDVLEHMVDPYSALSYAKSLLASEGRVVASIPNVRYFSNLWDVVIRGSWEYSDTGILDRTHLRFFTKSSIESMFIDLGYDIEVLEGINALEWENQARHRWIRHLVCLRRFEDTKWLQFAVVARANKRREL